MKKIISYISMVVTLMLSSCAFNLGFEPVRLYKFSTSLKYTVDNNVPQEKPEIQLFTSYESMCTYFDEYTYPYSGGNRVQADKDILAMVDFSKSNLLGYMREDDTGSTTRSVSVNDNNITIYYYCPEIGTADMAYKWFIFEVDKKYELSDFVIETKDMSERQIDYLINNYGDEYWF